ncbi:hypothetical protein CP533_2885 [Ophiocordyceps camponoti-saundersi (nom. inval.)]|nr:hypothetical protein CP533_2885 [Ophiocordyceps camponoti-saundersi (nom. inval.)]
MPKSKRSKIVHLTKVSKKTRDQKDALFQTIRSAVPEYKHCLVFNVDGMRNSHLKSVRRELREDSRLFFGKTKLMAKALGQSSEEEEAEGLHRLTRFLTGSVGLLFTNREPGEVVRYFEGMAKVDFARAGAVAARAFTIPSGIVYSTAGEVPPEHDVPLEHTLEPELRKLGVPTRMCKGRVVLGDEDGSGDGYTICDEGDVLDSRQTRLLKLFSVCMSEFRVKVLAYWSAASGEVTEVDASAMDGVEQD